MTLEGAQSRIWCSKVGWQTVACSSSIDGEAALTNSSPGARDQQSPRPDAVERRWNEWYHVSDVTACETLMRTY